MESLDNHRREHSDNGKLKRYLTEISFKFQPVYRVYLASLNLSI